MTTAVLLTCHGTIDRVEDIPAFLHNIRRGRPTPAHVVDEVQRRFQRIGGSPLMRITAEQGAALEARLGLLVRIAGRLWGPYPADVVAELAVSGVTTLISLPLAPQSVEIYHAGVREAGATHMEARPSRRRRCTWFRRGFACGGPRPGRGAHARRRERPVDEGSPSMFAAQAECPSTRGKITGAGTFVQRFDSTLEGATVQAARTWGEAVDATVP